MEIPVRLSSGLARSMGNTRITIQLEPGARVSDLLDRLCLEYPELTDKLNGTVAVVNGKTVDRSEPLYAGQEVAILSPIAGG